MVEKYPNIILIKHEEFLLDPLKSFEKLFKKIDLQWTEGVEKFIQNTNKPGSGHQITRILTKEIDKWKKSLTTEQIEMIKKGYNVFPQKFYQEFK